MVVVLIITHISNISTFNISAHYPSKHISYPLLRLQRKANPWSLNHFIMPTTPTGSQPGESFTLWQHRLDSTLTFCCPCFYRQIQLEWQWVIIFSWIFTGCGLRGCLTLSFWSAKKVVGSYPHFSTFCNSLHIWAKRCTTTKNGMNNVSEVELTFQAWLAGTLGRGKKPALTLFDLLLSSTFESSLG